MQWIVVNAKQSLNALLPIFFNEFDNSTVARLLHPSKTELPSVATAFGRIIDWRVTQYAKASSSILTNVTGKSTRERLEQPENVFVSISFTNPMIEADANALQPLYLLLVDYQYYTL